MTFEELGLNDVVLKALNDLGFTQPTPIQELTIPKILNEPSDLVALAQTGTGKTAAFGLPMLCSIEPSSSNIQALVLSPTRELCVQIANDLKKFAKYMPSTKVVSVYGGVSIDNQIRELKRGADIVVATPGRLVDMLDRKALNLNHVSIVVLDEADEMLNMGFKDDLDTILSGTPKTKSTWLFSATMPKEVLRIAKNYMENPVEISAGKRNQGAENIEHLYYVVGGRDRYAALKRIADFYPEIYGIVFCRTKAETQEVADALIKDGYNADALHGDLSQSQRDFVMKRYRSRTLQMLVATDVAARGIDVSNVTHVINYNLPEDTENYTHRSGRTARAGKSGISIAIVTSKDIGRIKEIEKIIGKTFTRKPVPNGVEVCEKQLFNLVNKLHHVEVNEKEIESYLPAIFEELKDLSKEELIKRFVSEEFNRFLEYYQSAPDLNPSGDKGDKGGARSSRFFINMGMMDGFNWRSMKDFLSEISNVNQKMIFNVDTKGSFSFFETEGKFKDEFLKLNSENIEFNGRILSVELSEGKKGGGGSRSGGGGGRRNFDGDGKKSFGKSRDGGGGFERKRSYGGGGGGGDRKRSSRGEGFGGERKSKGDFFSSKKRRS